MWNTRSILDMAQPKCRLCNVLIDTSNRCEAHIFPRGLLKAMAKDEYGQLLIVGTDMDRKKRAPIGSYDTEILCQSCDNKLGDYDDYAQNFIKESKLIDHPSGVGWTIDNVNHSKLKLFCVSYLWRASITQRPEFIGVNLGVKHEECIRQMLLKNNSQSPLQYTTILAKFENSSDKGEGILFPAKTRIKGLVFYEGYLPGLYKFWVKVDSQEDPTLSYASLGDKEYVFVHNRGDFDTSVERSIMVRAVQKSQ